LERGAAALDERRTIWQSTRFGEVAEWFKAEVLKTADHLRYFRGKIPTRPQKHHLDQLDKHFANYTNFAKMVLIRELRVGTGVGTVHI
jgi:hypothetical protein